MKIQRADYGKAVDAAYYQLDKCLTTKEVADLFEVKQNSVRCARYRLSIPHPIPRKHKMGLAINAAKNALFSNLTIEESAKFLGVEICSVRCAIRRLCYSWFKTKENRRLMKNKNFYYFRVRKKRVNFFIKLSKDINEARKMRDELEIKHKL